MIPISFVQELWPIIFQKTATDWQLLLLHRPIYSVRTIQYSRIFVEIWATFKQQRTLGDSILSQKDLIEWSAFHFKTQTFCAISNFVICESQFILSRKWLLQKWKVTGNHSLLPYSRILNSTHLVYWAKNQQKLSICCHFLKGQWIKFLHRKNGLH